jgi:hypothetical protein
MTRALPLLAIFCGCGGGDANPDGGPIDSGWTVSEDFYPPDARLDAPLADARPLPDAAPFVGCDFTPPTDGTCADTGGAYCWELPTAALTVASGVPDLSCGAPLPEVSPVGGTYTGTAVDYETGSPLARAEVFFVASPFSGYDVADRAGAYELDYVAGTPVRLDWHVRTSLLSSTIHTFRTGPIELLTLVSFGTVQTFAAAVGQTPTPPLAVALGTASDCAGQPLEHAIVTFSTASSAASVCPSFLGAARAFYFAGASPVDRGVAVETGPDGRFFVMEIPPSDSDDRWLQVWGFVDAADVSLGYPALRLIAQHAIEVMPDTVIVAAPPPTEGSP